MTKSGKKQIYEDEEKVIAELQKNARESIKKIAENCDFSYQKVGRIIHNLEENKKIWGYCAVADNEELNLNRYIILIKRSTEPIDDAISKIIELTMHRRGEEIGVNVECSSYLNGRYDWMFILTAEDIKSVKKFSDILTKEYQSVISDIHIMEDIFSVKKCGIVNPHMEKLRDFI